jgi:nitrogenase molybdenum-iron protein beta chain
MTDGLTNLHYTEESGEIDDILRGSGAEIVFGSTFEASVATSLGIPLIETSFPASRLGLTRGVGGFRGGLTLIEEIANLSEVH